MANIPVYKDDKMNQVSPWGFVGDNAEKIFTPLFDEDNETGEKLLCDGCFEMGSDEKTVVLLWAKGEVNGEVAHKVRIKAGNGVFGTNKDMEVTLYSGSVATITPESGWVKQTSGSERGKVILSPESGDIYVAVFEAP